MARPQQNQQQSKRTVRIPLVGSAQNRETNPNKDQRFVNFIPESNKTPINNSNKIFLVKRSGLELYSSPSSVAVGRGHYYYYSHVYSVFGNQLYKDTTSILTLSTSTGSVGWAEATGATKYLFLADGTDAYTIDISGTVTKVNQTYSAWTGSHDYALGDRVIPTVDNGFWYEVTTDSGSSGGGEPTWPTIVGNTVVDSGVTWTCKGSYGGFPTPHIAQPIFMDGYIFLAKSNTADIYNCDLESPQSWSAANFITAEMFPDNLLGLARQNNQLVALGHTSVEFFFDAGLASGSPLARNAPTVQQFGTCAPFATFQNEKFCILVGQSASGGRAVWQIDGTTPKKISTEYIEKIIDAEDGTIATCTAFGVRTQGHFLYVLTLDTMNRTLVYDVEEKMWSEWSTNVNDAHDKFVGKYATDIENGYILLQHVSDGKIYALKPTKYTDNGTSILCEATTAKIDFDTMDRKYICSTYIVGDTLETQSYIAFRWTDDDYQTWSNWKQINLAARAFFARLGQFRRRAFQYLYTDNYPCRLEAVEFDIRVGVH